MAGDYVRGRRALRITVGIAALALLLAGGGNRLYNEDNNQKVRIIFLC